MKNLKLLVLLLLPLLFFSSCEKDDDDPTAETILNINIGYNVDGAAVIFDSVIYMNEAGSNYSISKLHYYLSGFRFIKNDGAVDADDVFYIDIRNAETSKLSFQNFTPGNYSAVQFVIGVDSAHNITDELPNTLENLNMAWPEPMGGGYHHMKLEGHFMSEGAMHGYAMHLGLNKYSVNVELDKLFTVVLNTSNEIKLNMNINEWFRDPQVYDFNVDGNYSMGSMPAMMKLSANGVDVFND